MPATPQLNEACAADPLRFFTLTSIHTGLKETKSSLFLSSTSKQLNILASTYPNFESPVNKLDWIDAHKVVRRVRIELDVLWEKKR